MPKTLGTGVWGESWSWEDRECKASDGVFLMEEEEGDLERHSLSEDAPVGNGWSEAGGPSGMESGRKTTVLGYCQIGPGRERTDGHIFLLSLQVLSLQSQAHSKYSCMAWKYNKALF